MASEFFTVEELAEKLKVSEQTIRLWIRQGRLEAYQFGRAHRVPAEAYERFLAQSKVRPDPLEEIREEMRGNKFRPALIAVV
jgi:excisionase family DNA binding protein